jgi:DNA adenine methylase
MPNKSPLRYPGGKTRALPILQRYLDTYYPGRTCVLSPFLGGGSFELSQADAGKQVFANDLFLPLYTFWRELKYAPRELHAAVQQLLPMSKEDFLGFRKSRLEFSDPRQVAAAYFVVNRCSFSGATFCGGFSAEACEKRCNQSAVDRLLDVDMKNITLSNQDAVEFLRSHPERPDTVVYADPPYYITTYVYGKDGDMHGDFDHAGFADYLKTRSDWILSYNDCPYIRELYAGCRIVAESWKYGMNNGGKPSSEVIILPPEKTDVDASCEQSVDV